MLSVAKYDINSLGLDSAQYLQGAGIVGTRWDDVAIGCGETEAEAYEDALESLSQSDWDVSSMPIADDAGLDSETVAPEDSDLWYYVVVKVRAPHCECTACGCDEIATTYDDTGVPVCDECAEYVVDEDGDVHCARCPEVEVVTETCGAGGQLRTYARLRPPDPPEADPAGEWACCRVSSDIVRIVSRHTTRDDAEQAVAAQDWPPPGQEGRYLCGYEVRRLDGDRWVKPADWDD